jgi:uncharacterized membrane protein HdeD (DUF308 family)
MSGHAASPRSGTPGVASIQSFALTTAGGGVAWISAFFGMLLLVAAVICFISPEGTFAALADILGFVFFLVGVRWMIEAFLEREFNSLWWLWLISGILHDDPRLDE